MSTHVYSNGVEAIALLAHQHDDRSVMTSCACRSFSDPSPLYDADHCLDAPDYIPLGSVVRGIKHEATFTTRTRRDWL
jgi:hypothetical protein